MEYTVIHSKKQYIAYCEKIKELASKKSTTKIEDEMELLQVLVDKWAAENYKADKKAMDPIQLLSYIMETKNLSQADLVPILGINKSAVSQILNYKRGLSKEVIRKLAEYFKMSQEAFNRSYPLEKGSSKSHEKIREISRVKV